MVAGWSKNTQAELRTLLRSHDQPTDGSKAALVQRLTAFLSDYAHEATAVTTAGPALARWQHCQARATRTAGRSWNSRDPRLR